MFTRLGPIVTRYRWFIIAAWLAAGIGLLMVSQMRIHDVTTSDQKELLSESYESVKAAELGQRALGEAEGATTVTALVKRRDGQTLVPSDADSIASLAATSTRFRPNWEAMSGDVQFLTDERKQARVVAVTPGPIAPGGEFALVSLAFHGDPVDPATREAFMQFRTDAVDRFRDDGFSIGFTGGVASYTDMTEENESSQGSEQLLLFGGIILLSLLFFRGLLAAIVPLLAVTVVGGAASGLIVLTASTFDLNLAAETPTLITAVLTGIGIDYFLFLIFRHREQLRAGDDRKTAASNAVSRVGAVIASAALAIVVAFGTLALAEFGQFQMLGPAVAIAVLVMLFAGITLFPALLAVTGRALYWPSRSWKHDRSHGPAARLGNLIARRPAAVAVTSVALLVLLATGGIGAKIAFDVGGEEADTPATRVADEIAEVLPRGATDPVEVYVEGSKPLTAAALQPLKARLVEIDGVGSVSEPILSSDGRVALVDVSLNHESDSTAAMDLVRGPIREIAYSSAPASAEVLVGGTPAVYADVDKSVMRDLKLIFPVAAILILLILIALLRSIVAPVYLLLAVGLEFAATFGAAVLVFQRLFGDAGVAFSLPIVLFLFVFALGTDYNMLIASRLREERDAGRSTREGTANAVRLAVPAMTAAGLALAVAFSSLMLYPDKATKQMGFAMAVGILLAALVVSALLVPALTALVGERAWWPGRRSPVQRDRGSVPAPAPIASVETRR